MKRFQVTVNIPMTATQIVYVEADNREEAAEIACQEVRFSPNWEIPDEIDVDGLWVDSDCDICEINFID